MNKLFIYLISLILFLILSKIAAPENVGIKYIKSAKDLESIVDNKPAEAILIKTLVKGYIIKTYYQEYQVIYGFSDPVKIKVKAKRSFVQSHKEFTGMSLFRIDENDKISTTPLPPGSLFIGNGQFGRWAFEKKTFYWKFYRTFTHFPNLLGWGNFAPNRDFYHNIQESLVKNTSYKGPNAEFGEEGFITEKFIPILQRRKTPVFNKVKYLFNDYQKWNFHY